MRFFPSGSTLALEKSSRLPPLYLAGSSYIRHNLVSGSRITWRACCRVGAQDSRGYLLSACSFGGGLTSKGDQGQPLVLSIMSPQFFRGKEGVE